MPWMVMVFHPNSDNGAWVKGDKFIRWKQNRRSYQRQITFHGDRQEAETLAASMRVKHPNHIYWEIEVDLDFVNDVLTKDRRRFHGS